MVADVRLPTSDLGGLNFIRISDTPECRSKIASRLKLVGCAVETDGKDWLRAGEFVGLAALRRSP